MKHLVAPSMLSANFANLAQDIQMVNNSQADWFHIDVMDGVFVPNISFGFPVLKVIKKLARKPLDVHLMIIEPQRYFQDFVTAGADWLSFHLEAATHVHRSVYAIKELGAKAGLVINPHTPVSALDDIIADLDLICLMSVNPGFGGQKYIDNTYQKIRTLKNLIEMKKSSAIIEVDGGVGLANAKQLIEAGADVLVAGNSIFGAENATIAIEELKNI
jgi:ribulose-phosphate 3-epimerase